MSHAAQMMSPIRAVRRDDVAALKAVIDAAGLFPVEMLDVMLAPYFNGEATGDVWLTYDDGVPVSGRPRQGDLPQGVVGAARMTREPQRDAPGLKPFSGDRQIGQAAYQHDGQTPR